MSTILQLASADKNLSTLVKGLKAANMGESLSEAGPFTLFCPVNFAFSSAIPDFETLLKSTNTDKLSDILRGHVLAGKKMFRDFRDGQVFKTLNGKDVAVSVKNGEVRINGARILSKDRQASNGVMHSLESMTLSS